MEPLKRVSPPPRESEVAAPRCAVLVVDDSRGDQRLAREAIDGAEFEVLAAASGSEALALVEQRTPDVVLLDLTLPDMDGVEVLRQLRAGEATRDLPVIILTGRTDTGAVVSGLAQGANDYITKPYDPEVMCARIRMHHAAKQTRDELSRVKRCKEEFLSVASHDLQNPVSTIIGYAGLLLEGHGGELAAGQRDAVNRILKNANFMRELVADLLDLSKIEAGRMELYPEYISLAEIARESVERNAFAANDKDIRLRCVVDPKTPLLFADPLKLQQLLNNLISNGIKFSNPGAQVEVAVQRALGGVELAVSDTGQGIPEAEREHLFRKWGQLSVRATRGEKSTGLGLLIAKKIVDLHGGRVWVESEVGKGSTFHVFLPLRAAAPAAR